MQSIYFYEAGAPELGAVGTLSFDKGAFVSVLGAALDFVPQARLTLESQGNATPSDHDIFELLSDNWTNGNTFTLDSLLTPEQVAEFVG